MEFVDDFVDISALVNSDLLTRSVANYFDPKKYVNLTKITRFIFVHEFSFEFLNEVNVLADD